jgi:hypothetical protein
MSHPFWSLPSRTLPSDTLIPVLVCRISGNESKPERITILPAKIHRFFTFMYARQLVEKFWSSSPNVD